MKMSRAERLLRELQRENRFRPIEAITAAFEELEQRRDTWKKRAHSTIDALLRRRRIHVRRWEEAGQLFLDFYNMRTDEFVAKHGHGISTKTIGDHFRALLPMPCPAHSDCLDWHCPVCNECDDECTCGGGPCTGCRVSDSGPDIHPDCERHNGDYLRLDADGRASAAAYQSAKLRNQESA